MFNQRASLGLMVAATLGFLGLSVSGVRAACSDPAAAELVRAQIASECVCSAATNHGQYVKCVGQHVRQAVANGLPTNCKGAVMRCAARSTCGKPGFVTCCRVLAGKCRNALCQDGLTACTVNEDCPTRSKCSTKRSVDLCVAAGGSAGGGSCCDAVCAASPSGAFLNN